MKILSNILPAMIAAVALAGITGCGILKKTEQPATVPVTKVEPIDTVTPRSVLESLEGEWSITEVSGKKVVINGEDHPKLTFEISPDVASMIDVIGFNGCNYINGAWNVRGNRITPAGEFLTSLKSCQDAPYEFAVNSALNEAASFTLDGPSDLTLKSHSDHPVMKLHKRNLSFLNGAWRVIAINGEPVQASIRFVLDPDNGTIHGNAGCNLLNGELVVNLDKGDGIEFRNLATSRMTCPDIAAEKAFLIALENVDTAAKGADGEALLKDNSGNTVLTLKRISIEELNDER